MRNARIILTGGPFPGTTDLTLPPDIAAPIQLVWSGWTPHGFSAHIYQWYGERLVSALIYRSTGRTLATGDLPPALAEATELWADTAALIAEAFRIPPALLWPGT
jgi:hypothetical protein